MTPQQPDESVDRWSPTQRIEAVTRQNMRLREQISSLQEHINTLKHVNHLLTDDYEQARDKIKRLEKQLRKLNPLPPKPPKPEPPYYSTSPFIRLYVRAHREHAWLLRAEGLTFVEIGKHMGTSKEVARQKVACFQRMIGWATRRTHWHYD